MASARERWEELKSQTRSWLAEGAKDLHNHIVPAFPTFVHGVDQPGTPLNMTPEQPSFEESMAKQRQKSPEPVQEPDKGIEP